jgi:hypothetical protein
MVRRVFLRAAIVVAVAAVPTAAGADPIIADHTSTAAFELVPASLIEDVKNDYRIFYGHTSHGSQVVTGMEMLFDEDPLYAYNDGPGSLYLTEYGDDLGHNGDVSWVPITRSYLDSPSYDINVVVWSWCGGCSDNTEEGIDIYLAAMTELENDYPDVIFVYMTGHLDGSGPEGNLYARNNQIRDYCVANGKVLFDFADIESWDPDGVYYPDEDDGCGWCSVWCSANPCPPCDSCAHSHCFNCYQKGKAFWWMLAAARSGAATGVGEEPVAGQSLLLESRPNPFNPPARIYFSLPQASRATLEVFTMAGRRVATLVDGDLRAGPYSIRWDGADSRGRPVASGSYFYRLRAGDAIDTKKMLLLK